MVAEATLDVKDGIHLGMAREEYERIEAVNYSLLKHFQRSAAHARENMLHPPDPTEAMDLGNALHHAILEPARFRAEYVAAPQCDKRTRIGKATWTEFQDDNRGKNILKADEMEKCRGMMEAAYDHPIVRQLLSAPGKNEVVVVWTDAKTGLHCKGMLDRITSYGGWTVVCDLKSCRDARPFIFASQAASLLYHEQAAFYLDGLHAAAPLIRRFFWLAVESERPHALAVYEPDDEALKAGRSLYSDHLEAYKDCLEKNHWPGYPVELRTLRLPGWALTGDE